MNSILAVVDRVKSIGVDRLSFSILRNPVPVNKGKGGGPATAGQSPAIAASLENVSTFTDPNRGRRADLDSVMRHKYQAAEIHAAKLAAQWRAENARAEPDREVLQRLQTEITKSVRAAFNHRQLLQQQQIAALRADLQKVESQHSRREKNSEQIIHRRVTDLVHGSDLSWLPTDVTTATQSPESVQTQDAPPMLVSPGDKPAQRRLNPWCRRMGLELKPTGPNTVGKRTYQGGLLVQSVRQDSPSHQAGMRQGDVLLGIGTWKVASFSDLEGILSQLETSSHNRFKMDLLRHGQMFFGHLRA
ncbi:MAG: PDZ domain-containing protein, partial [Pirellulales bacterium]|nr:PDZ domain-containing protein [Pirellulales bacterium]